MLNIEKFVVLPGSSLFNMFSKLICDAIPSLVLAGDTAVYLRVVEDTGMGYSV